MTECPPGSFRDQFQICRECPAEQAGLVAIVHAQNVNLEPTKMKKVNLHAKAVRVGLKAPKEQQRALVSAHAPITLNIVR